MASSAPISYNEAGTKTPELVKNIHRMIYVDDSTVQTCNKILALQTYKERFDELNRIVTNADTKDRPILLHMIWLFMKKTEQDTELEGKNEKEQDDWKKLWNALNTNLDVTIEHTKINMEPDAKTQTVETLLEAIQKYRVSKDSSVDTRGTTLMRPLGHQPNGLGTSYQHNADRSQSPSSDGSSYGSETPAVTNPGIQRSDVPASFRYPLGFC